MHLWEVLVEDDLVKDAQTEIQDILEKNLDTAEKAIHVYDQFTFILKEKQRIDAFLQDTNQHSRERFEEEIRKFEETADRIRETMPYEIRMNMFLIDCAELNNKLCEQCESLINDILDKASELVFTEKAQNIQGEVKKI